MAVRRSPLASLAHKFRWTAVPALLSLVVVALPLAPAAGAEGAVAAKKRGWRTLGAKGGFKIKAPRGYRLKLVRGAYEVSGPAGKMTLLALSTDGSARTVAEALLGGLPETPDPSRFGLLVRQRNGALAEVYFDQAPGGVAVTALTPPKKKKKRKKGRRRGRSASSSAVRRLGKAQRRLFARMARSARNLRTVGLPTSTTQEQEPPIPLKPFTTADGGATAMVPDAPGWVAGGAQGIVEGGHPDLGSYAFGVLGGFALPGACLPFTCDAIEAPAAPVAQALEQSWPLWLRSAGLDVSGVQVTSQVANSAGLLGPGFDSGMFQFSFQANGKAGIGYVIAGVFVPGDGTWRLYYSYIAAYNGVPGTVGDALLRTWQSWDPSVNQAERRKQTFITLQETTQVIQSANEYRLRVYEKTNYNWDAYIRGKDPVLDPVAPNAIGEGGQTLVQGPEGKLFNFSGQQFKKPGE